MLYAQGGWQSSLLFEVVAPVDFPDLLFSERFIRVGPTAPLLQLQSQTLPALIAEINFIALPDNLKLLVISAQLGVQPS